MVEEKAMEGLNVYKDSVNLGDREKLVDLGDGYMSWNETPGKKNMEGARSLRKEDLEYYGRQLLSGHDYHTRFDSDGTGEIAYDSKKGFTLIDSKKNEFPVSSDRTFNFDYFFPEFSPGLMGGVTERVKNPKMDKWKKVGALVGAGLVLASPVADIGGVEVASAKLVYKNPSGEIVVNVDSDYRANSIDSEFPMIDFPKAKDYEANSGLPKFGGISTHTVLAKLLTESRENPNSQYSPIYNDAQFDKYLDSIVSDAQKAREIGVKSLIPTPEGEFLDTISQGVYGQVSQINTIAQMGYYMQSISETSAKMLEETRKSPERSSKVSSTINSAINAKLDRVVHDYNLYKSRNSYSVDENGNTVYSIPNYSADSLVYFFGSADLEEESLVLQDYVDRYGYDLPPGIEFITIPSTQENLKMIEIAESLDQKYGNPARPLQILGDEQDEYIYLGNLGYWFSHAKTEGNKIWIPPKMKSNWQKFDSSSEFEDHTKYWENKALEDRSKALTKLMEDYKKVKEKYEEADGPLVRTFIYDFKETSKHMVGEEDPEHPFTNMYGIKVRVCDEVPTIRGAMEEMDYIVKNINNFKPIERRTEGSSWSGTYPYPSDTNYTREGEIKWLDDKLERTKNNSVYELLHKLDSFWEKRQNNSKK